ncbi:MAG: D-alanyl-D-alanine carboxypeptidase [Coriobacteriia bacterium]|nr:D-alanyl-D-alanine carboxypeptidase [Coriobacteriia bacterium]
MKALKSRYLYLSLLLVLFGSKALALAGFNGSLAARLLEPMPAYADVRSDDLVAGIPLADRHVDDTPNIVAPSALVAAEDGTVLWERGGLIRRPMASTTKIMTAVVALENASLDMECTVTWGAASTGGTSAWLEQGDRLTLYDLLIGLLLPSGNNAGVAIAENVAGTQYQFVEMMNAKARELGMLDTHYVDPHGLDEEGLYTTAEDYLVLARYAMRNQTFREIVCMTSATIYTLDGREISYVSTNKLFYMMDGVMGIKTGTNYEADACLVSCVNHQGTVFYAVVLGSPTDETRYSDMVNILEWAFRHYRPVELINSNYVVADLALVSWLDKTVTVRAPYPVSIPIFDLAGLITQEVQLNDWEGSITKGQKVGRIIWTQNNEVIATSDLVAAETIDGPGFKERMSIGWDRFFGGLTQQAGHAQTLIYLPEFLDISF